MFCSFVKSILKLYSLPETINPAATFKATDCENSFDFPLYISTIFSALYSLHFSF